MHLRLAATLLLVAVCFPVSGNEERPLVTQVGDHLYRLGEIELDSKLREIRMPVTVNMREGGPIEYLLVHENGKVHEAIFVTKVSPLHLQIAMKLLKFEAGFGDLFNAQLPPHLLESEGGSKEERGESMEFFYLEDGESSEAPAADMILDGETMEPMGEGGWVHTGSSVHEGNFMAEIEGSIVAVYLDPLAMFNMSRPGADIDERWGANPDAIPEIGTRGLLVIRRQSD